jgi:glucose/arabinose dehydrogenase
VSVPFVGAEPAGDGFEGAEVIADSDDAEHRPMGLAQSPDGALYITDSAPGRIWRITYDG